MAIIEIDLEDYKDEIKYAFCYNNNCLAREIQVCALKKFRIYIEDLEKSIFNFNDCHKTPEDFLRDLKMLYAEMR